MLLILGFQRPTMPTIKINLFAVQEVDFHWNSNFADGTFAKLKSRLLLQFYKSLIDSLYD